MQLIAQIPDPLANVLRDPREFLGSDACAIPNTAHNPNLVRNLRAVRKLLDLEKEDDVVSEHDRLTLGSFLYEPLRHVSAASVIKRRHGVVEDDSATMFRCSHLCQEERERNGAALALAEDIADIDGSTCSEAERYLSLPFHAS